ncbi:MAG: metallophosphoesterase [Vicinamibacterales bacterium]
MVNGKVSLIFLLASLLAAPACRDSRAASAAAPEQAQPAVALPNKAGTYKFAVLGDFGTGSREQYELAREMADVHSRFKYEHVILVGDNLYGSERPQDFKRKFEQPYKPLLDAGVKFYASLGNHDSREQRYYKPFNMGEKLYYSFNPQAEVRFFALETTYPEPEQIKWFQSELKSSGSHWKIPFFHHPLYSSGERHGSDIRLRRALEPMLLEHSVSVVFTGHDHFYERTKPQKGITYFVVGSGGKLREGNIDSDSGITAKGFDRDLSFLVAEIDGDQMYFNAISRTGQVIDSGVITRRKPPTP